MRFLLAILIAVPVWAQDQQAVSPAPATDQKTASPAPSTDQWLTGSVEFGYRWLTDIAGSLATYRSIINLGEGPKLFGLDFTVLDPKKRLFDRLNVRAYNWGGDPYNTAHIDARKLGIYDFSADYRNIIYFNALPSFANPFAPAGFDQQSFDVHKRMADVSLELVPGKHIVPYLAWAHNGNHGQGIGTWVTDSDPSNVYPVPSLIRDSTENYRGGVRFEYNRFHVTLEQGGTTFKDDDQAFDNIPNPGDLTTPFLGQPLVLNSFQQAYAIRGSSIYSRGLVTATPTSWLTLTGQFLYSQPKTDVHYTATATGNLAVLAMLYSGITDLATGTAKQPHTTANLGGEVRPSKKLRIIESWITDRYHDASFGLLATTLYNGAVPTSTSLEASPELQIVNYNQQEVDAIYDVTDRLTLRGGHRYVWGYATVRAGQLSQTGNFASGLLHRNVALAGASFRVFDKLRTNLDYERGLSDDVYFHTSLNDYHRVRARAQYRVNSSLSLSANFTLLNNQNPAPSVQYNFQTQNESLLVNWAPNASKRISFVGEYDHTYLNSNINYISLPFFNTAVSRYRDHAHTASSSAVLPLPGYHGLTPRLEAGGSLFISSGSRPTRFYQPLARLSMPIDKHVSWNAEWRWYGFGEPFYLYEGFRVHAFTMSLRVTR
jgi:hypothetical protein